MRFRAGSPYSLLIGISQHVNVMFLEILMDFSGKEEGRGRGENIRYLPQILFLSQMHKIVLRVFHALDPPTSSGA